MALGLVSRLVPLGYLLWDKYLGDAVYAAAFYLGLSLVWPRGTIRAKIVLTTVYVVAIETFQLTSVPAQLGQSDNPAVKLCSAGGRPGARFLPGQQEWATILPRTSVRAIRVEQVP